MTSCVSQFKILGRELRVERLVGSGGFGDVLLVYRMRLEASPRHGFTFPPQCVVKVMRSGLCEPSELAQAQQEVRTLKALDHPNVVRYLGSWMEASRGPYHGSFCIALQYCEGGDVAALIRRCAELRRAPPADVVVRLMAQVFSALNYSHSRHLIHRDIKPGNIFLTACHNGVVGDAVVGDYGLVRSLTMTRETVASRVGTPSYISPEIVAGEPYTVKTDIFSAGTMFYELATLVRPFWRTGIAERQLFTAVLKYDPMPRFRRLVGDTCGAALVEVLAACLAKLEKDRASAYDVLVRIASPVSVYVRSNAIPVYVEKRSPSPPAARASPAPVSATSPERAEVVPSAAEAVAAAAAVDGDAGTVRAALDAMFLRRDGPSAGRLLANMLPHDPELVFQIRVLVACRAADDKYLFKGLRDIFRLHGYKLDSPSVVNAIHVVMQTYPSMLTLDLQ